MKNYPLGTDPSIPLSFGAPTGGGGGGECVPNVDTSPGLDDEDCWNRIDSGAGDEASTVSADGFTWVKTFPHDVSNPDEQHFVEFSNWYNAAEDLLWPGPPCQPRPCAGIRLSFDYVLSLAVSTLTGSPSCETTLRLFAEIQEFQEGGAAGNGSSDDFDGQISSSVDGSTFAAAEVVLEIPGGDMVDAAIIASSLFNRITFSDNAGSGTAEIEVDVTITNLAWEII